MEEDIRVELAVVKERLVNVSDQLKRFISHLESEQRVTHNISKRVDTIQNLIDRQNEMKNAEKKDSRWKTETTIGIISLLTSIAVMIITLLKN